VMPVFHMAKTDWAIREPDIPFEGTSITPTVSCSDTSKNGCNNLARQSL
jgi:hypothetical protein